MSDPTVGKREFDTYTAMVNNSVGSNSWRNIYAVVAGSKQDVANNGEFSCTYFVSSVLKIFSLVENYHATVMRTIEDMEKSGWQKVDKPEIGDVILWGKKENGSNEHLGIYIGDDKTVSNSLTNIGWNPAIHNWLYEDEPENKRPLLGIYRGKHLFKS